MTTKAALPRNVTDSASFQTWRKEWLLSVTRCRFGKNTQAVAVVLCFYSWQESNDHHELGTYTSGHLGIAEAAGIYTDADHDKRIRVVSDALAPLKRAGWVAMDYPWNGNQGRNAVIRLTAPHVLEPVSLSSG